MKTPLLVVHDKLGRECAIYDDDDELLTLAEVCKYINAHAAQPGAPREDGVWDVLLTNRRTRTVLRKGGAYYTDGVYRAANFEDRIIAHRKPIPMEVPDAKL